MSAVPELDAIVRALGILSRRFDVDVLEACDSTNAVLLARAEAGAPSGTVVVAKSQTAGRGRRGRTWLSASGDSLTFSLLWRFTPDIQPAGLSLAVGLAVAKAIEKVGVGRTAPIQLKWPNDLLKDGRKLGGILVELVPGSRSDTGFAAVIGIGLNLQLPEAMPPELRAQSAALDDASDTAVLLAAMLAELLAMLESFDTTGFAPLREAWSARHAFGDVPVRLLSDFAPLRDGICRGVDEDGALLLEVNGRIERVLSGEVSLRPAQ